MLELVVGEEEVVQFDGRVGLFVALLHLLGPHGAVDVDELVDLEGDQASRDGELTVKPAKETLESDLGVLDEDVLLLTELGRLIEGRALVLLVFRS